MKTEHALAETLKNLMSEVPLDDISVTLLTKKCRVKRQTFYYHFHDIYDLLTQVFLDESIPNIEECKTIKSMVKCIYQYYIKNKKFLDAALNSAGKELFEEFVFNATYQSILRMVTRVSDSKKLTPNDKKYIARFYALAYSHSIIYYLNTHKNTSLEGLYTCFCFVNDDNIEKSVQKFVKIRGKAHD